MLQYTDNDLKKIYRLCIAGKENFDNISIQEKDFLLMIYKDLIEDFEGTLFSYYMIDRLFVDVTEEMAYRFSILK